MPDAMSTSPSPIARSFAEHVRSFHAGLLEDEQRLLEKVFAMAEQAASSGDDVQGYAAVDFFLKLNAAPTTGLPQSSLWNALGGPDTRPGGFTGGVRGG